MPSLRVTGVADPVPGRTKRTDNGPMWYAQRPARAARQMTADAAVAAWTLAWILTGTWVGGLVRSLAAPVRQIAATGAQAESAAASAGTSVADLPLVGDRLAGVFATLAGPGAQTRQAATTLAGDIETLGTAVGVLTAAAPILLAVLPWLALRVAFARRAGAARRLLLTGAGPELFALRALTGAPPARLLALDPDPAAAWRRGDPDVVRALADVELARLGLRGPGAAPGVTPPR